MAFLTYNPRYQDRRAQVMSDNEAREIDRLLHNLPGDLTEEQYDYLQCIEHIYYSKRKPAENVPETTTEHLTHPGVYQSRDSALPAGDRD